KSLKNVHYQSGKFALGTILCAVIPNNPQELDARYLHQYLQFYKDIILVPLMKGAANVSLSMKDILAVEFPLPPIERQRELSNLFVSLQEKQKELSAEYEKQTEYAKLLRQNILQQAIEGKLTADWRNQNPVQKGNPDYDAEALFEQIQKGEVSPSLQPASQFFATPSPRGKAPKTPENSREFFEEKLDRERKRTNNARSKSLAPITEEEKPFEIPAGWKWVRLGEIGNWASGATPSKSELTYYVNGTIPWLRTGDLNDNVISSLPITITEKALNECSLRLNPIDSVLIAMYGATIGKVGILKTQATTNQACCACIPYQSNFSQYLFYLLIALREYFKEKSWGAAQPNISKEIIIKTPFALPPLKEQEEIVSIVETLLAKVTELENQIQDRKSLSDKLIFGIIKENLEG
ncbi:restriction endonuclease subunit S, partial [Treponema porcinum]|uniref:restriction endonuclease subunit S n=1 Tax=Treponema porcinum TaxID=261392 RepID=UPI0023F19293